MKKRPIALRFAPIFVLLTATLSVRADEPRLSTWIDEKLAVQLYTFHAQAEHDIAQTMHTIRELGFRRVELYPVAGVSAAQMHAALEHEHLRAIGAHVPLDDIDKKLPQVIADAKLLGLHQVGAPWIKPATSDPSAPMTIADLDAAANVINRACKPLRAAGIRLYVHPHGFEFAQVDGKSFLQRLLDQVSPQCLSLQLDVFWAASAGADPAQLMRADRGRISSIHLKDRRKGSSSPIPWQANAKDSVVLGTGNLNIPEILGLVKDQSIPSLIIEDESPDSVAQIKQSLHYLATIH